MVKNERTPNWSDRLRYWRLFSDLAYRNGRTDNLFMALALGWAHALFSPRTSTWVFSFGIRGLVIGWPRAINRKIYEVLQKATLRRKSKTATFRVLLIPQVSKPYYYNPCFALGKALRDIHGEAAVAIVTPKGVSKNEFERLGRDIGYNGEIIDLDLSFPLWFPGAIISAFRRLSALLRLKGPPELVWFFRAHPRKRFFELFSNEVLLRRFESQLKYLGVTKVVTMHEQHFPSNILVAAANRLGIETHQVFHGAYPSEMCVPFHCKYSWAEYEWTARGLERCGADPSRLRVLPGLQTGSQVNPAFCALVRRQRCSDEKPRLLVFAQYHGYSVYGTPFFKDALCMVFKAISMRKQSWEMAIRPHPWDSEEDVRSVRELLDEFGLSACFTDPGVDLAKEASRADLVATAASNAIFTSIASGTPACLLWGPEQIEAHGTAPLSKEWIANSVADVIGILDRVSQAGPTQISTFAKEQARALGLVDLENAPRRFCDALFASNHRSTAEPHC